MTFHDTQMTIESKRTPEMNSIKVMRGVSGKQHLLLLSSTSNHLCLLLFFFFAALIDGLEFKRSRDTHEEFEQLLIFEEFEQTHFSQKFICGCHRIELEASHDETSSLSLSSHLYHHLFLS